MGIMTFLRNRAGLVLVGVIGLAIVAFLAGDVIRFGGSYFRGDATIVGQIAGEKINADEFKAKVELNEANFKQQMGQSTLTPQMSAYVVENTWNQTIAEVLLNKESKRLGLEVGKSELNEMLTGKNPDPQVVQAFGDPQTGQINRQQLNAFLSNIETQGRNSAMSEQWGNFLLSLKRSRLFQKYNGLIRSSLYVTSLETREDYNQRNRTANFNYINLDYASVPDAKIKLTDKDYTEYYNENKKLFAVKEETRSFDYVVFDASPSREDSLAAVNTINRLATEFRSTANDSLFVSVNADTKMPLAYVKRGELDPSLDSLVFNAGSGAVVGPVYSNGSYKLAKVLDIKMSPDSVSARHILLNPAAEGGVDKARAKADSIVNLLGKGENFAALAAKFSVDGSKDQGGELGTFARGAMVPAFEQAVFNGKVGDTKIVNTQFGVHIINIQKQVGSSRVAKVAVVDKVVASSNETQQQAYAKASAFMSDVKDAKDFDEYVKKHGLRKMVAEDLSRSRMDIPGIENPREIARWAFHADEGDLSDRVFEMSTSYIVAKLTDIRKAGILPMEKVKKDIEPFVRNRVKARMLSEQAQQALNGTSSINQVAQKLKKPVQPVENIVFANPVIPGADMENKVVGTVFGLKANKLSKPIEGNSGVFVVQVNSISEPAPLTNTFTHKQQILQGLDQRAQGQVLQVLRDKADIKDNRLMFF